MRQYNSRALETRDAKDARDTWRLPKTIMVDMDSTLNDLDEVWLRYYNAEYGDSLTPEALVSWNIQQYVKPECGPKMYDYLDEPQLYFDCRPKPGAFEVTRKLIDAGHDLFVASAAVPKSADPKASWLREHFPHIPESNFIIIHRKGLLRGDLLIDDGWHNVIAFKGTGFLFAAPWNAVQWREEGERVNSERARLGWGPIIRVNGWQMIENLLLRPPRRSKAPAPAEALAVR